LHGADFKQGIDPIAACDPGTFSAVLASAFLAALRWPQQQEPPAQSLPHAHASACATASNVDAVTAVSPRAVPPVRVTTTATTNGVSRRPRRDAIG
jgi:hypothetical protein